MKFLNFKIFLNFIIKCAEGTMNYENLHGELIDFLIGCGVKANKTNKWTSNFKPFFKQQIVA